LAFGRLQIRKKIHAIQAFMRHETWPHGFFVDNERVICYNLTEEKEIERDRKKESRSVCGEQPYGLIEGNEYG